MNQTSNFKNGIRTLSPGYFALVMATGIIATGCQQLQYKQLASALFVLSNVLYAILLLLFIARSLLFFPQVTADLSDHTKSPGFLTFVAGSAVLGTGYVQGKQLVAPAIVLLTVALIAWVILVYTFLSAVILSRRKPPLEKGIDGTWLLLIVSTQSLVVLSTSVATAVSIPVGITLFACLAAWLAGILFYVIFVTIITYRLTFFPVTPAEASPSYWIDAGSAAITVVAGVSVSAALQGAHTFQPYIPVIHVLSLLFWAVATFWLPLLVILETWRHRKAGFRYTPAYWSMVFPLGMYSVATLRVATALQAPFLHSLAVVFIFVALATWLVVFAGMLVTVFKTVKQ